MGENNNLNVRKIASSSPIRVQNIFSQFHERMLLEKFNMIYDKELCHEGEIIYNRGDENTSNFFVFVKANGKGVRISFFNPDYSKTAAGLSPGEIHELHFIPSISNSYTDKSIEKIIEKIKDISLRKPKDKYFAVLHGHWGKINGEKLIDLHIDDGYSSEMQIIRQMMFYHQDIDGTGHHNHIVPELLNRIIGLEKLAKIEKIPSIELTLPFAPGARNGPHHNIWFSSLESAMEYDSQILKKRSGKHPSYAPLVSPEKIIEYNLEMAKAKQLAVGLAHPAATEIGRLGLLDRVANTDYNRHWAVDYVKENVHGIGAFNPTLPMKRELEFQNPSEKKYFIELLEKWNLGKKSTPNAINLAFSLEMKEKFGKFRYADNDSHLYLDIGFDYHIHGLGKTFTVINYPNSKPSAKNIVELMLSPNASTNIEPFIPYDFSQGFIDLTKPRRNEYMIQKVWGKMDQWRVNLKIGSIVLHDMLDAAKTVFR